MCLEDAEYNQAIIFTATREDTDRITAILNEQNLHAIALRGDLPQNQRAQIMSEFSRGQHSVLVTTDVASRGLDLLKVGLVINFDLPKQSDEYIHRIGRTGRAGKKGHAVSLVGPRDWRSFESIIKHIDYALGCTDHEQSPAKFKGFKPKKEASKTARDTGSKQQEATRKPAKPKKRVDTIAGEDVGMKPVMRKKRNTDITDDE